jgi:hypothetical protein
MVVKLLKKLVYYFHPFRYGEISEQKFCKSLKFLSLILLFAFIIAGILWIPRVFQLKSQMTEELNKFESFEVSHNLTMTAPVAIPYTKPLLVIDTTAPRNISQEYLLVTKEQVQFRFFGINTIPTEHLTHAPEHKEEASGFIAKFIAMLIPGIALFLYIRAWIKYFLLIIAAGTIFFIILDLTKFKLKWKQMLNLSALMITPMVLLEVISAPISTEYLMPIGRFLGTELYLITLALYAALMIFGIVFVHIKRKR